MLNNTGAGVGVYGVLEHQCWCLVEMLLNASVSSVNENSGLYYLGVFLLFFFLIMF